MGYKKKQLVLEHLEGLSGRVLEEYQDEIKKLIRGRSGVYVLYRRSKLYYVGLAKNLMGRLKEHLRDRHDKEWDRFSVYVTVHNDHIKELESLLLRITSPSGNRQGGKFIASENLHPILARAVRNSDGDRRAVLLGGAVARRRRRAKGKQEKGAVVLAGLVERRFRLKAIYKGYEYTAFVRKDGRISYGGTLFNSPTAASLAVSPTRRNGWRSWHFRNELGEWVALREFKR